MVNALLTTFAVLIPSINGLPVTQTFVKGHRGSFTSKRSPLLAPVVGTGDSLQNEATVERQDEFTNSIARRSLPHVYEPRSLLELRKPKIETRSKYKNIKQQHYYGKGGKKSKSGKGTKGAEHPVRKPHPPNVDCEEEPPPASKGKGYSSSFFAKNNGYRRALDNIMWSNGDNVKWYGKGGNGGKGYGKGGRYRVHCKPAMSPETARPTPSSGEVTAFPTEAPSVTPPGLATVSPSRSQLDTSASPIPASSAPTESTSMPSDIPAAQETPSPSPSGPYSESEDQTKIPTGDDETFSPAPTASEDEPTMPSPTMPSPTMPSPTMPSPTMPSPTMPSPTMPSPTMPSPTTPTAPDGGGTPNPTEFDDKTPSPTEKDDAGAGTLEPTAEGAGEKPTPSPHISTPSFHTNPPTPTQGPPDPPSGPSPPTAPTAPTPPPPSTPTAPTAPPPSAPSPATPSPSLSPTTSPTTTPFPTFVPTVTPEGVRVDLSDFVARYILTATRDATIREVQVLNFETRTYLGDVFETLFNVTDNVLYEAFTSNVLSTGPNVNGVIEVGFEASAYFLDETNTEIPTQGQLDGILVESLENIEYVNVLNTELPSSNIFSTVTNVTIPLSGPNKNLNLKDDETSTKQVDSGSSGSSGASAGLIAAIVCCAVGVTAFAGYLLYNRHQRKSTSKDGMSELQPGESSLESQSLFSSTDGGQSVNSNIKNRKKEGSRTSSRLKSLFMIRESNEENETAQGDSNLDPTSLLWDKQEEMHEIGLVSNEDEERPETLGSM